jgi:ABC-type nitrate/sulfonate/bicarbonate transport system substrate-binding protein
MANYEPLEIHGYFRSHTHLPVWYIVEETGIWEQMGIKASFDYCDSSSEAEAALFEGRVDFISGNHISPYALVARGKPIVSLASPSNSVNDRLVTRQPVASVAELRGKSIADTTITDPGGGYNHIRGNHMLYILRGGLSLDDVKWVEVANINSQEARKAQLQAMIDNKADATMVTGGTVEFEKAGFHVLPLGQLPMVNGPTLTTTMDDLQRKDRLGERLVKALVLGIHYARTHKPETEQILEKLKKQYAEAASLNYNSVAKLLAKPYPDIQAIANAYELCCMKTDDAKKLSPLALWNLHFLRDLDNSGFIDGLYK